MSGPVTPLTPAQEAQAKASAAKEGYVMRNLVALDMDANVLMGGSDDETISSRMARWACEGKGLRRAIGSVISKGLDLLQRNHGARAVAGDAERAAIVLETENATGLLPKDE